MKNLPHNQIYIHTHVCTTRTNGDRKKGGGKGKGKLNHMERERAYERQFHQEKQVYRAIEKERIETLCQ